MDTLLTQQPPYLSEVVDRIVRKFHPLKIILFGSWARGDAREDSDLDLLVVLPTVEHKRKAAIEVLRVLNGLPISKDAVVTTPQEIEEHGKSVGDILHPHWKREKSFMNPNDAKVWLGYAETDLRAAHALLESGDFFPRQICFFAKQCGEKAIKSVLVFEDVYFPKNHDLDRLRDQIPDGWKFKEQFPDLAELTIWAVESRYPGNTPDVTEDEAKETLKLADAVFDAVSAELEERIQQNGQDNSLE